MHILRARREEVQEAATGSTADIEYSAVQRRVMNEFPQGPSSDELQERILVPVKAILIVYGGVPGIVDLGCSDGFDFAAFRHGLSVSLDGTATTYFP